MSGEDSSMHEILNENHLVTIVIPVYKNEGNLPELVQSLSLIKARLASPIEVVFVVDGSPDNSWEWLTNNHDLRQLCLCRFILLSRNFGALAAVRRGIREASGDVICVIAADGQEPPDLVLEMTAPIVREEVEVVVGIRERRADSMSTRIFSCIFWMTFRLFGGRELPRRGVDVFAISARVARLLNEYKESSTSLIGLIYWSGFNRREIPYTRGKRKIGKSSWTFKKRAKYALDSITSFSEAPIAILIILGVFGFIVSSVFGTVVLVAQLLWSNSPPGYTPLILGLAFVSSTQLLGMGILGMYIWRISENVRSRPATIDWKLISTSPNPDSSKQV